MSIVLDGTSGITTNSGTVVSTTDATLNGLTVGKGGGSVSTNTAVGASALNSNTTAAQVTAFGYQAAYSQTNPDGNSAFGYQAMYSNATGANSVAIGRRAAYTATDLDNTVAVGAYSLTSNTTGDNNTAIGKDSLYSNTTASNNTAVGYQAGYSNATGTGVTNIGAYAGYTATGNYNTFVGQSTGYSVTTGTQNTFIGVPSATQNCGGLMTTGSKNTIIGNYSGNNGGLDIRTASNYIVLSDGDGNPRIYVNSAGSMYAPSVYNTTAGVSSNLYVDSSGLFYRATSSLKYKTDVENATHGLADVLKLRPITYRGKAEVDVGKTYGGLLAEEVHDAGLTEFVQYADDGSPDALHYGNMVSLAFKAIQELKALVDAQATLISGQAAEIAQLKAKVG